MKRLITILLVALVGLLGACDNQVGSTTFDQAMKQGNQAIQEKQYAQAADYFKEAEKIKKENANAQALYTQSSYLAKASEDLKVNRFNEALQSLNHVMMQRGGSGVLISQARKLKGKAMFALMQNQKEETGGTASATGSGDDSSVQASASSSAGTAATATVDTGSSTSAAQSSASASSAADSSSVNQEETTTGLQQKAEQAVAQAVGYSPANLYFITTDNGSYYSIELRENHSGDSAADPDTAPSLGFFRYYKQSGKITQLNIVSNKYLEIK